MMKRILKRTLAILMTVVMLIGIAPVAGFVGMEFVSKAKALEETGQCGKNLTWTIDREGTLTINGTGEIPGYWNNFEHPWSYRKDITKIRISDGITRIGRYAFRGLPNLEFFSVGSDVSYIDAPIFSSSYNLNELCVDEDNSRYYCENNCIIYKIFSNGHYRIHLGCKNSIIPNDELVTYIYDNAFEDCRNLASISIPSNIVKIGTGAFEGCEMLSEISISNNVSEIGYCAFYNCKALKHISLPNNLSTIASLTFGNCINLHSVYIGSGVTTIRYDAFEGCSKDLIIYYSGTQEQWRSITTGSTKDITTIFDFCVHCSDGTIGDDPITETGELHAVTFNPMSTTEIYQFNGTLDDYVTTVVLNGSDVYIDNVTIDGKKYNIKKDVLSTDKAEQLKGKSVICNYDKNAEEIIAISKCREFSDLDQTDISSINKENRISVIIANEYKWLNGKVYVAGGTKEAGFIPFKIEIGNSLPSEYFDLTDSCKNDPVFDITISDVKLTGLENCGQVYLNDNPFPKTVKLGKSVYLEGGIYFPSDFCLGYEDSEKVITAKYEIQMNVGKDEKAFQTVVKNRDPKPQTQNENALLTDAANKLKKTPTSAISLALLETELGFTPNQVRFLEKLVLVELSLYTMPGETLEEYVSKKVMEKIFGVKSTVGVKNGKMTIVVPAKYQGRDIQVDIVCDITDYTLMNRTFGNFTNLTYHAYYLKNGKREKNDFKNGEAGLAVSADVEEFAKAATDLALGEIKSATKTALSGYEEVKKIIFGDTALKILNAAGYKSNFDFGWELYVNKCKELVYKCPVDIYVYDKADQLCGAIVNNEVTLNTSEAVDLEVKNDDKIVTLWEDGYYIKTLSNCTGTLNISVQEKGYVNGDVRTLSFENLPLEIGTIYKQGCGTDYYDNQEAYAVELLNGETIQATTDNLCIQPSAKYTVTYNANGGNIKESSETVHEGEYVILPMAERNGYKFVGWSKSNDNTSDFEAETALKINADTALFAVWEKIPTTKPSVKSVSVSDLKLNYKKSATLNPTITADEGVNYTVKYESSNPKVATVDQNGKVTATKRGSGSATITCTVTDEYGNVVKDTCKVDVKLSFGQWLIVILLFGWIWY